MHIVMLGLGHATAPVTVRERTSFSGSALAMGLSRLMAQPGVYEGVILSTCNRTEIYAVVEDGPTGQAVLEAAGGAVLNLDGTPMRYGHADRQFLNPLFAAAASLELAQTAAAEMRRLLHTHAA